MTGTGAPPPDVAAPARREPPDPRMVPLAMACTAIWAIAAVAVLPFRAEHGSWFWICVAGFLWGIPGTLTMVRHDAKRRPRS